MADRSVQPRPEARSAERAFVLTVATFILLTPPILSIFDVPVALFGIPLLHIYSFAVWLAAIGLGAWLGPRMGVSVAAASDRPADAGKD